MAAKLSYFMTIELPGYTADFANQVYSRSYTGDSKATTSDGKVVDLTDVLLLTHYKKPSEQDVVEFIRRKAEDVRGSAMLVGPRGERLSSGKNIVEEAIKALPIQMQVDLQTGDEKLYDFIKKYATAYPLLEGEARSQYLVVDYGLLPTEVIEANHKTGKVDGINWYRAAFAHDQFQAVGLGLQWQAKILYEGRLPSQQDMDILLKHSTNDSQTFTINKKPYDSEAVRAVLRSIYAAMENNSDGLAELQDGSAEALQAVALSPIIKLHELLERQMRAQQEAQATLKGARPAVPSGLIKP